MQCANLGAAQWMNRVDTAFAAFDRYTCLLPIQDDAGPWEIADLICAQAVPIGDQNQRGVALA
jgi:hypothetical protein